MPCASMYYNAMLAQQWPRGVYTLHKHTRQWPHVQQWPHVHTLHKHMRPLLYMRPLPHVPIVQQWDCCTAMGVGTDIAERWNLIQIVHVGFRTAAGAGSKVTLASSRAGDFSTSSLFGLTHCAFCINCLHSSQLSAKGGIRKNKICHGITYTTCLAHILKHMPVEH